MLVFRERSSDPNRTANGADPNRPDTRGDSTSSRESIRPDSSREGKGTDTSRNRHAENSSPTLIEAREAYERDYILKKIDEHHGNITRAAESLGLERSHLYRKMKALGVSVKE